MDAQMPRRHGWRGAAGAQPFGFPHVLGQTGEAVNSLRSDIRPFVSGLPCAARLRVSRSWWAVPPLLSSRALRSKVWRSQASRLPRSLRSLAMTRFDRVPFLLPSFLWASKEKKGACGAPAAFTNHRPGGTQNPFRTARLPRSLCALAMAAIPGSEPG